LDQYAHGKLPRRRRRPGPVNTATVELYLSLVQQPSSRDRERARCATVDGRSFTLFPGESVRVDVPMRVWLVMSDGRLSRWKYFNPLAGQRALAVRGPLHRPAQPGTELSRQPKPAPNAIPLTVCAAPGDAGLGVIPESSAVFEGDNGSTIAKIPVSLSSPSSK